MSAPIVKSPEKFAQEVFDLVKDEYTILTPYKRSSIKIKMRHNKCGHEYNVTPNSFLRGGRCPYCNGNKAKHKNTEQFKEEVYDLVGDEYTVLGKYINRSTPILMQHNKCGREYLVEPGNFLYRSRCIECYYESKRIGIKEAKKRILENLGPSYELIKCAHNVCDDSILKHLICGHTFKVRLDDVVQKHSGCHFCNESRGEEFVRDYLKYKGYKFIFQKKFKGLKDVNPLSFDFYLPNQNTLIEYQGTQHFMPKTFGNISKEEAVKRLAIQKKHDNLKRSYAKDHGINLLEPNYKLDSFSKVSLYLSKELLKVKQGTLNQK